MKLTPVTLIFAMLGVASARVGESVSASDQDETRNLQEDDFIKIEFDISNIATNNIRVMVGYKNDQGKLKAIATEASELINEFKIVDALTMIIPSAGLGILASDPDIK
jgi:hypothetical protein